MNEVLDAHYDIIVLDLGGVATDLSKDDGYGVLKNLKSSEPYLPIIVVTGSTATPDEVEVLGQADLVRAKPILAAELSNDVELILRHHKSEFWASLEILTELNKINSDIQKNLSWFDQIFLHFYKQSIAKKILNEEKDVISKLKKVVNITSKLGKVAYKIKKISLGVG
ncbi:MAG: DNA-binding response regulator [Candidatus Electrothrix sp. GM3_4]|nr:DNA-binding response regulator [Candidatus Electrothrix sp. GM3_4]